MIFDTNSRRNTSIGITAAGISMTCKPRSHTRIQPRAKATVPLHGGQENNREQSPELLRMELHRLQTTKKGGDIGSLSGGVTE